MKGSALISLLVMACIATAMRPADMPVKSVNFFPLTAEVLGTDAMIAELGEVAKLGANFVSVNFMIAQDGANGTAVFNTSKTPTLDSLSTFINAAHQYNLGVFLKPVIVCGGACVMPYVNPSNVTAWFESYADWIVAFATFAESQDVEILSFALELLQLSNQYREEWIDVITAVRNEFTGQLTYCSIFYPVETAKVVFWDYLDFISMDTYLPMMEALNSTFPTQEQMNEKYAGYLEYVNAWLSAQPANISSLPVVLSEVGYPSSISGMVTPYGNAADVCEGEFASNVTAQEMAFSAVFNAATNTSLNLQGIAIFWFDNPSSPDYCANKASNNWACNWTPRGKPAESVIANAWEGAVASLC